MRNGAITVLELQIGINVVRFEEVSDQAVTRNAREGLWPVYESYELVPVEGQDEVYVVAAPWHVTDEDLQPPGPPLEKELYPGPKRVFAETSFGHRFANEPRETYRPLAFPDLFLQFARLFEEEEIGAATILEWVDTYGVLGVNDYQEGFQTDAHHGGPEETVMRFRAEAFDAYRTLKFYEDAILPRDTHALALRRSWVNHPDLSPAKLKAAAVEHVEAWVHEKMYEWCYPRPYKQANGAYGRGFGFKSLLGAMWLQIFWLLTAEDEPPLCEWCGRTVYIYSPPGEQTEKKPRKDTRFCRGGACRQAAYRDRKRTITRED